jgi:mono/diheme cytochrome c family protein
MYKIFYLSLFLFFTCFIQGCGTETKNIKADNGISGFQIYKQHCVTCHGDNGRMGLNGAKPLPESKMTQEERITHITNGKGAMQPYKGILSTEEIKAVAEYTFQLK